MPHLLRFLLPFTYFWQSRLTQLKDWVFHGLYEWILNLLLLIYFSDSQLVLSLSHFIFGYIAFISIYEIGYIFNDFISTKFEENPRRRITNYDPSYLAIGLMILVRLSVFTAITLFWLPSSSLYTWLLFYCLLTLTFTLHNTLKTKPLKIITFFNLAWFRFLAPIFLWIPDEHQMSLMAGTLVCYVLFRTLTYMDSKQLLDIPQRRSSTFRLGFYILLLPFVTFVSWSNESWVALGMTIYYLLVWVLLGSLEQGIRKES